MKKAMLAKDKDRLRALRSIKSMILLAQTEKGGKATLTEKDENALLMKAAKQRKDSAEVYKEQGRTDLEQVELEELKVIQEYLPEQLSEEEVAEKLKSIIEETGAKGPQDMGKVMGVATKELAGKADNKIISVITKSLLNRAN